jgi:high affinity sulfate transporter 1
LRTTGPGARWGEQERKPRFRGCGFGPLTFMGGITTVTGNVRVAGLRRIAPGLATLLDYHRGDLPHDLIAGLSVAAVALPVGIAYAELAGFAPVVGLYSSIFPLFAYALFGTSRQLIVGPDAATCALVAAAVAPLAGGDRNLYHALSIELAFFAGILCLCATFLKLGALADFLSRPILVGFLNGIALSIILGQLGKIFGFSITAGGIVPRLIEFVRKLDLTHWPTLAVGLGAFLVLLVTPRLSRMLPAPLLAMIVAALAVRLLGLEAHGVKIVGEVPRGLPPFKMPRVHFDLLPSVLDDAAGLALVTFSSMMLTSRSFASKNKYDIDPDKELAALGLANIAAAFSQGFAVSGADSRTAVSDRCGGRTQVAGLVAGATVALVLLFFTGPLRYVPVAVVGAILVQAALSLIDTSALRSIYRIDRREFGLSVLATVGVVAVGAVRAILIAVILAILRFVRLVFRPRTEILSSMEGAPGFEVTEHEGEMVSIPGLLLLRFNAPIVFFNAPYFKRTVLRAAEHAGPSLKWLVLDMAPVTMIDATGLYAAEEVADLLGEQGVTFAGAGRKTEWDVWAASRLRAPEKRKIVVYRTLGEAAAAFQQLERSPQQARTQTAGLL